MEREEIYKERKIIEEFRVDEKNTLNNALFDVLFNFDYVSNRSDIEKSILGLFNDAYYICTLILLEKRPYFKIKKYKDIIGADNNSIMSYDANKVIIVMSMVYDYLKTLDLISFDIEKTTNVIRSEFSGCDENIFETISSVVERKEWSTKAYLFYPFIYPKDEQCSDYWENYHNSPKHISDTINSKIETLIGHTDSEDRVKQIVRDNGKKNKQGKSLFQLYKDGLIGGSVGTPSKNVKELKTERLDNKEQNDGLQSELNIIRREHTDVVSEYEKRIEELQKELQAYKKKNIGKKPFPQLLLTNNSNFARVVQAMVSARYFKRANGEETNATEVGSMLLKIFGVTNSWKSVLQKAFSCENPLMTYDDLRDAGQRYWDERFGITDDIKKKGRNSRRHK